MRRAWVRLCAVTFVAVLAGACTSGASPTGLDKIEHIVVIYQENHSFDNLFGMWGDVAGAHVNGLTGADPAHTVQVAEDGTPLGCLFQNEVNLASAAPATCSDPAHPASQGTPPTPKPVTSAFGNAPFPIDKYIPAQATTCSTSGASTDVKDGTGKPGGCTEDLVHRFYQEQYQINGGRQSRYVAGSDAAGLAMGYYDTTKLPIYSYLHGAKAPNYVLADNFFAGAFGGSFLNHQLLVAGQAPVFASADHSGQTTGCADGIANCDLHSALDSNRVPTAYPYYTPTSPVLKDQSLTVAADGSGQCAPSFAGATPAPSGTLCGDYAVNTIQPFTQPYQPGTDPGKHLPLLTTPNIGDALTEHRLGWAWYSGGWDNAVGNNGRDTNHPLGPGWNAGPNQTTVGSCAGPVVKNAVFPNCPDPLFQFHHQPLGYFANYADGTATRAQHLKDEKQFLLDVAKPDTLPAVSFVKPIGAENEHPGYASEAGGSSHLVDLIKAIQDGPNAQNTLVVVTYDEFGGQWDHVPPPGSAGGPAGPHDSFGPGTRVPTLLISPALTTGVDHTPHDTTSILATIEHRFGLPALTGPDGKPTREATVADLGGAFQTGR
ncbi:MAG: acid phosphatase [Pseudonocardia sp.]|nr:acid phosphatase [Pseudonocardia sp.]